MSQRTVGYRGLSEGFWVRNPNLSNLYLQISKSNPQQKFSLSLFEGGPKGEELLKLNMPVLFIVGEDDDLTPHILSNSPQNTSKGLGFLWFLVAVIPYILRIQMSLTLR